MEETYQVKLPYWVNTLVTGHSIRPYRTYKFLLPQRKKKISGGACNVGIKGSMLFVESWLTNVTLDVITELNGFQMTQQSVAQQRLVEHGTHHYLGAALQQG